MMRVAIVVQRCHKSLAAGSERHARFFADCLKATAETEVLTTNALRADDWSGDLPCGSSVEDGVTVRRFAVSGRRSAYHARLHDQLLTIWNSRMAEPGPGGDAQFFGNAGAFPGELDGFPDRDAGPRISREMIPWPRALQEEWVRAQGPMSEDLFRFLEAQAGDYDRIVFCTYLFATSYFGAQCVAPERSYLLPALHDEPSAYLSVFRGMARRMRGLLYNTAAERRLARRLWGDLPGEEVGAGVELAEPLAEDRAAVDELWSGDALYYAGRIHPGKGCGLLIEWFQRFRKERGEGQDLTLILTGALELDLPADAAIRFIGFVSESRKRAILDRALAFVMPSEMESFSIATIEAMAAGRPVLARSSCAPVADHVRASGGGLLLDGYASFAAALDWLRSHRREAEAMGARGRAYACGRYGVGAVSARLLKALDIPA